MHADHNVVCGKTLRRATQLSSLHSRDIRFVMAPQGNQASLGQVVNNHDGTYTATYTVTKAGPYTVQVALGAIDSGARSFPAVCAPAGTAPANCEVRCHHC